MFWLMFIFSQQLKNTMMNKHFAKEQKDTINRESQQIAQAM